MKHAKLWAAYVAIVVTGFIALACTAAQRQKLDDAHRRSCELVMEQQAERAGISLEDVKKAHMASCLARYGAASEEVAAGVSGE